MNKKIWTKFNALRYKRLQEACGGKWWLKEYFRQDKRTNYI